MGATLNLALAACLAFAAQQKVSAPASATHSPASGNFIVAGRVINAGTGEPISKAEVVLTPQFRGPAAQSMLTNASGSFIFGDVAAGRYTLFARRRGFMQQSYLEHGPYYSAVVVGPEFDTTSFSLKLPATGTITGHVYDSSGEPLRRARVVVLMRDPANSARQLVPRGNVETNDEGGYRVGRLPAGTYFVAVSAQPWYARHPQTISVATRAETMISTGISTRMSAPGNGYPPPDPRIDVAYEQTFFGGANDAANAEAIQLGEGETRGADITLNALPARHIRITTGDSTQYPNVMPRNDFGAFPIGQPFQAIPVDQGVWELVGVPPGAIHATLQVFDPKTRTSRTENIELGSDSEIKAEQPAAGAGVRGRLTGDAGFQPTGSQIQLRTPDYPQTFTAAVSADGSFEFRERLMPGEYSLFVGGGNEMHYLTSMTATGARVNGRRVEIGSQDAVLNLSVSGNLAQCSGFVLRDGKHAAGMLVALLAQDAATRELALARIYQSDADGSYSFQNVVPGSYRLFALDGAWELDYNNPGFLNQFAAKGESLVARPGDKKTIDLTAVDAKAAAPTSANH